MVGEANKYLSDQAPWKLKDDPARLKTILHVALQVVDDAKTLLTPFLPNSSDKVHELLGGEGVWSGMPEIQEVDEDGGPGYPVLTGDYDDRGALGVPRRSRPGVPLAPPTPLFTKLDPSVVDEELARLGAGMSEQRSGRRRAAAAPEPLPVEVFDSHCHLDIIETPVPERPGRRAGRRHPPVR